MGREREACDSLKDAATAVTERDGARGADEMALAAYEDMARISAAMTGPEAEQVAGAAVLAVERLESDWPHHLSTPAGRRAASRSRASTGAWATRSAPRPTLAPCSSPPATTTGAADEACRLLADSSGSAVARPDSSRTCSPASSARRRRATTCGAPSTPAAV